MSQPWDFIAKLVCIGDSGTGKSSVSVFLVLLVQGTGANLGIAHCSTL